MRFASLVALSMVTVACADATSPGTGGTTSVPRPTDAFARLDVYEPLIREMAGLEGRLDGPLVVNDLICDGAGDPVDAGATCDESFTTVEQAELQDRLADLDVEVRFASGWEDVIGEQLENPERLIYVWVGPLESHGETYWSGAGMWCGGKCGHGGTYVVASLGDVWRVEGPAPGTSTWIS